MLTTFTVNNGVVTKQIPGLILRYDINDGKGTCGLVVGMLGACIGQLHLQQ